MSTRTTAATLLAAAVLLTACGGDDATIDPAGTTEPSEVATTEAAAPTEPASETPAPTEAPAETESGMTISLTVSGDTVSGADDRVTVALGEEVTLEVTSDAAHEIHLHGYDLTADVEAGGTATITFTADIPGVFEAELEDAGTKLVELEVR